MKHYGQFYINGEWVDPVRSTTFELINPATEKPFASVSLGCEEDVDRAVQAARQAFPAYSSKTKAERLALLERIVEVFQAREDDIMAAITMEMGAPKTLRAQTGTALAAFKQAIVTLQGLRFRDAPGRQHREARADRRLRPHFRLELADPAVVQQAVVGARRGLHAGGQAERVHADQHHRPRRGHARGRGAEGSLQPGQWRRPDGGARDQRASWHRPGVLHRFHEGWRPRRRGGRADHQARVPGTRGQVGQHHPARRRPARRRPAGTSRAAFRTAPSPAMRRPASWCTSNSSRSWWNS